MIPEETKQQFKKCLTNVTKYFNNELSPEIISELKDEINNSLTKNDVVDCWILLLKVQGPIEKISDNKYEIYDVSNFIDETSGSTDDYIHTVDLIS